MKVPRFSNLCLAVCMLSAFMFVSRTCAAEREGRQTELTKPSSAIEPVDRSKELTATQLAISAKSQPERAPEENVTVVCAVQDIPAGATIGSNAVEEREIDLLHLAARYTVFGSGQTPGPYVSSKSDAIGQVSKGIRKGQILFHSYPGLRGNTVVLATRDIPYGATIKEDCVVETDQIRSCDIPVLAASSLAEVVGQKSTGIKKWQVLSIEQGKYWGLVCGSDLNSGYHCYLSTTVDTKSGLTGVESYNYAIREITAGRITREADVIRANGHCYEVYTFH